MSLRGGICIECETTRKSRTGLFWAIMQQVLVISYRRFGTIGFCLQEIYIVAEA
jgi:hypothetical protein